MSAFLCGCLSRNYANNAKVLLYLYTMIRKTTVWLRSAWHKPRSRFLLIIAVFAVIGSAILFTSHAATFSIPLEPELGTFSGNVTPGHDDGASGSNNNYISFGNGTTSTTWTWPATLQNTGPSAGTTFTTMAQRDFTSADNGKTFDGIQINATDPRGIYITASNITFKNCKIMYTATATSNNGFIYIGDGSTTNAPKNVNFDHCIIDDGNRFEYNIRARYGQFNIQYSQVRGGSHNIDAFGDVDAGGTINIYRNYIYDYDDKPYHSTDRYGGHAAVVYFSSNNGTVNIEDNTIIGNRWEACTSGGFSNGPGAGCRDNSSSPPFNGTGSVVVYADEDSYPDKTYVVKHNQISGSSYYPVRFYGGSSGIQSVQILNNVYTAQSGYPKFSLEGNIYTLDSGVKSRTISGNSWGTDTTCYATPSACPGNPNSAN